MTSRAGVGEAGGAGVEEAGGAGVGATQPPVPGWITSIYNIFRILVLSEDPSRVDFVTTGLLTFGYSVTSINDCGLAVKMLTKQNAFHMVVIDDTVEGMSLKILFAIIKTWAENVCVIVFTPDYTSRNAKLYLGQGAQLIVPYDQINLFYPFFWQFGLVKGKFLSDLKSAKEQRKKMRWDEESRTDFQTAIPFAGPEPSARSVAELMTVTGVNTQSVGNYMQRIRNSRAGAAGAGPSVAQPPIQPPFVEQLAQAEAGASVAPLSSFVGAGATAEGSRDPVLDTEDAFFSDLDFFQDFLHD